MDLQSLADGEVGRRSPHKGEMTGTRAGSAVLGGGRDSKNASQESCWGPKDGGMGVERKG